jgi:polyhydroxyalkanoate synthesis regulator phasin
VKETEGELARLRRLEANHLTELNAIKQVEQEKVDNLNQRLGEVDEKCQKLSNEMATQSKVLSETAKRWVDEISVLDRGLAGTLFFTCCIFPFSFRLLAGGWRQGSAGGR